MSLLTKVVPDAIYQKRLERMKTLIELKAPAFIIWSEAKLIVRSHKMPWTYYVAQWWALRCPVWLDGEWWKWKITGKSDFYEPLYLPEFNGDMCNRLWEAVFGPNPCPACLCDDLDKYHKYRTLAGNGLVLPAVVASSSTPPKRCLCSCHGWESYD